MEKFTPPDVEELEARKDVTGLIEALSYRKDVCDDEIYSIASLVRMDAAKALGELGDPGAVEPLIAASMDNDPLIRWRAVMALGKIGDPRAVVPLITALDDIYSKISESAAAILNNFLKQQSLEEHSKKLILSVQKNIDRQLRKLEEKKDILLEDARRYWLDKPDPNNKIYVCDACNERIHEKEGTSLLAGFMRCNNCTDIMFLRWDKIGCDILRFCEDYKAFN